MGFQLFCAFLLFVIGFVGALMIEMAQLRARTHVVLVVVLTLVIGGLYLFSPIAKPEFWVFQIGVAILLLVPIVVGHAAAILFGGLMKMSI